MDLMEGTGEQKSARDPGKEISSLGFDGKTGVFFACAKIAQTDPQAAFTVVLRAVPALNAGTLDVLISIPLPSWLSSSLLPNSVPAGS
jgi:hypothetical protein